MYSLIDFTTKKTVTAKNFIFTGEKNPWEVVMDIEQIRSKINVDYFMKSPPYVSKYLPFMPIRDYSSFVSLNEGSTPLLKSRVIGESLGIDLYFKIEMQNPTGSFKDRGSAVDLTVARELGAKGIVLASTGNMAASCSCYAAAAKMPCFIFVPEDTPASKLSQAISYGGRIVQIKGTYSQAAALAEKVAGELGFYLGGDYAYRVEGQKTAAFELIDQLFYRVPEMVMIPIGCGTNVAAYAKGFSEYQQLGFIDSIPQLIGVQATGASSVVNAVNAGSHEIKALPSIETIAGAIAVNYPLDGVKALEGIYKSGGTALAVSDREMLEAQYLLAKEEGLFVEVSSASSIAALKNLAQQQDIKGKTIVCVMTGGGLKDPSSILKIAIKPPTINPDINNFLSLYRNSFFDGRTISFVDRAATLFTKTPSRDEIRACLFEHFNITYADFQLDKIILVIGQFLSKGKSITFADIQDIVQDVLEKVESPVAARQLKVVDFSVATGKDKKAEATVTVTVGGKEFCTSASGVGPVDAILAALSVACGDKQGYELSDYKVEIRGTGADAVVFVGLKLKHDGIVSVGSGASPDIIQASIVAFETAYNGL